MIQPIQNKVLIKAVTPPYSGNLILLGGGYQRVKNNWSEYGEVVATGPNCLDVKKGDKVYLGRIPYTTVNEREALYVVLEQDIQGLMTEGKNNE